MKNIMKKIVSMAAAVVVGTVSMGAATPAIRVFAAVNNLSDEGIMPLYEFSDTQNFNVAYGGASSSSGRFTYVVKDAPARMQYVTCTRGSANVQIYKGNKQMKRFTVDAGKTSDPIEIECKKGSKITIFITPNLADGYAKAQGSFCIMPLSEFSDMQNFNAAYGGASSSLGRFTYVVKDVPARMQYVTCTRGSANVQIYIGNKQIKRFTVDAGKKSDPVEIGGKKGSKIIILITPNLADGYAKAQGSFCILQ